MIIHIADSGKSFELGEFQPSDRVEAIQVVLESLTGVSRQDQLLFCGEARLDSQKSLQSYRLPADEQRPVFLFNRQRLVLNSPPPTREEFPENVRPVVPDVPPASSYRSELFENSWDASVRALPSYETQFRFHFQKGNALLAASRNKLDVCYKLGREMEVQAMALESVQRSMDHHYRSIDNSYSEFMAEFSERNQFYSGVLESFNRDIEKLRRCKLHSSLRTATRESLLDCVKEGALRKSFDDCAATYKQLRKKVNALGGDYVELKSSTEDFLRDSTGASMQQVKNTLKLYSSLPVEQATILESLKNDVIKVKRLIEDYVQGKCTGTQAEDAFIGLGAMHDMQVTSHLPKMEEYDFKLEKLLEFLVDQKNLMNNHVHQRMQSCASLQASIKMVRNQMLGLQEVLSHQRDNFEQLTLPRRVSRSYTACLAEVVRRKAYLKLYFGQAGQLAEKIAAKREREQSRRDEFLQVHARVLPQELVGAMGLLDSPSQCVVDIAPFDNNLLDIELRDVEHYAPTDSMRLAGNELEVDDESESHYISGTDRLEVENARLKAQLASSLAIICSMDASFRLECMGDPEDLEIKLDDRGSRNVAERTAEALRLKDEHAQQLKKVLDEKQAQCITYESRIRELEEKLREREEGSSLLPDMYATAPPIDMSSSDNQVEESGVTGVEPMDSARSEEKILMTEDGECDVNMAEETTSSVEQLQRAPEELPSFELSKLRQELDSNLELLKESQMNSADLERRLHEAREEARTHSFAANRRATEYNALRASTVKLHGLLERLRYCVATPTTDALCTLSASLESDLGDDVGVEFQLFVRTLVERIMGLSQQRAELLKRCTVAEESQLQLRKEIVDKAGMAKSLFTKCKLAKQASQEKLCLTRFDVNQMALFFPNKDGHYEALNWNRPKYFLCKPSVAVFRAQAQGGGEPAFIIGQIVHIAQHVAKLNEPNSYGVSAGELYHLVTLAVVPGLMM